MPNSVEIVSRMPINEDTIERVVEAVSMITQVSEGVILSKSRTRSAVAARNMIFNVLREGLGMTLAAIGKRFDKSHATIIHANRMHAIDMQSNASYRARFEALLERLGVRYTESISHSGISKLIEQNMYRKKPIVID